LKKQSSRRSVAAAQSPVPHWRRKCSKAKPLTRHSASNNTEIVNELSLPPVKIHCSLLAEDAIKAAIDDYKKKTIGVETPSRRWSKDLRLGPVHRPLLQDRLW